MTTNEHDPHTELVSYDRPVGDRYGRQDEDTPRWVRRLPEFVVEQRPSLVQWLRESGRPEPGQDEQAAWRVAWTRLVALPTKVIARMWDEAAETPGRLIPALLLAVMLGTAANQLPIANWVVPDQLDVTSWF